MRYASVCSGIESATCAWRPLGWCPVWFAEIEPFASAVLEYRWPGVPNRGDFTKIDVKPGSVDLLVGGTPCQSFSVAGQRAGLSDPRGNLALEFLRLARRLRPRWLVWENVPGVLSSGGGWDLGVFLGALGECGYGFAYRVLDAQYFGVPQRRRRVFVVGYPGDWTRAAEVLFERESLCGDSQTGGEAGERLASSLAGRSGRPGGQVAYGGNNTQGPIDLATARNGHSGPHGRLDFESETFIAHTYPCLRSINHHDNSDPGMHASMLIPVSINNDSRAAWSEQTAPLRGGARSQGAIAFQERGRADGRNLEYQEDMAYAMTAPNGGGRRHELNIAHRTAVRRLTPVECERLQGFEDGYTMIPWKGRPAEACPDGPRYRAIGNAMAVPVMRWIGERIHRVEART